MDRNQPLIGGRLELENAPAFAAQVKAIERSIKSLNNTLEKSAAEGLGRRLTAISKGYDKLAQSAGAAAVGLAAVNIQSAQLGKSALAINRLTKSMASLNKAGGSASLMNALSSIAGTPSARVAGSNARGPLTSSPLKLDTQQSLIRRQNAGIIGANIAAARERRLSLDKIAQQEIDDADQRSKKYLADFKKFEQRALKSANAWAKQRTIETEKAAKLRPRIRTTYAGFPRSTAMGAATYKTSPQYKAVLRQQAADNRRAQAEAERLFKERQRVASQMIRDHKRMEQEEERQAARQRRSRGLGGVFGGGRGRRGASAAAGGFLGGRASKPADFVPGMPLGATGYLRGAIGPTAIYTRMPLTMTSIAAASVIAAAAVTALGSQFAKTANALKVFSDATDRENKLLIKGAIDLSRAYTTSANDIVQSGVQLAKAGAPVEDLSNGLLEYVTILTEVSGGQLSASESSTVLTQIIRGMKLDWDQVGNVVDATAGVILNSAAEFDDLAVVVQQLIPVGSAVGFTYEELITTFGVLRDAGLGASVASTALKNSMLAIADPSSEAAEILKKYKISLFDANGEALPLIDVITDLWKAFGDGNAEIEDAQAFFEMADIASTRQILAIATLAEQGPKAYNKLATASAKSARQMAMDLQNNPIKQLELLGNQIQANALLVANEFTPTLTNILRNTQLSLGGSGEQWTELGKKINDIITLNDDYALSLVQALGPGTEDLIKSIIQIFVDAGDQSTEFGALVLKAAKLASTGMTTLADNIDKVREKFKSMAGDDPLSTKEIESAIALNMQRIARFSAFLQTTHDYISTWADPREGSGIDKWNALFQKNLNDTRQAMGLVDKTVDSARETFATDAAKLGLAASDATTDMVKGIEYATGTLADASTHTGVLLVEATSEFGQIYSYDKLATPLIETIDTTTGKLVSAIGVTMDLAGSRVVGFMDEIALRFSDAAAAAASIISNSMGMWDLPWARATLPPMDNSMGMWDLPGVLTPTIPRPGRRPPGIGRTQAPGPGGGGGPSIDDFAQQIKALLSDVPGLTDELFQFLGGLAHDLPTRLLPMVGAIKQSRAEIGKIIIARKSLLEIDSQLLTSARNLARLQGEQGRLEIQQAIAVLGYDQQLLGLRHQILVIDQQMQPLQDQLLRIDREAAKLQQENLVLSRQRLSIEIEMLPIKKDIEALDRKIAALDREDYAFSIKRLQIEHQLLGPKKELSIIEQAIADIQKRNFGTEREMIKADIEALPLRRQIRDIEDQITRTIDKRAAIRSQLKSLDLADVQDELAEAWEKFDVASIIRLEAEEKAIQDSLKDNEKAERQAERRRLGLELEKVALEEQLDPIERRRQIAQDAADDAELFNSLILLGLEEEKAALEEIIVAAEQRIGALEQERAERDLITEAIKLSYQAERQALEDVLGPLEEKLSAINREIETENLKNQLALTHLEEERIKIQALLQPLEDQRRAIERIIGEIDFLRAAASLEFEERKLQIQGMVLAEQLRQAELEATRREQELLFVALVQGFLDAVTASGAFTTEEALEVAKRGKLWDKNVEDLFEIKTELDRVTSAASAYGDELDALPKDITITITTVHRDVYESGGPTGSGGTAATPAGVNNAAMRSSSNVRAPQDVINNVNYNVSASYSQTQSPASVSDDMRALVMMAAN